MRHFFFSMENVIFVQNGFFLKIVSKHKYAWYVFGVMERSLQLISTEKMLKLLNFERKKNRNSFCNLESNVQTKKKSVFNWIWKVINHVMHTLPVIMIKSDTRKFHKLILCHLWTFHNFYRVKLNKTQSVMQSIKKKSPALFVYINVVAVLICCNFPLI